jgi:hypothetical protein
MPSLSGGTFSPNTPITREAVATAIVSLLEARGEVHLLSDKEVDSALMGVPDASAISQPSRQYVATAMADRLMGRTASGGFAPAGTVTRSQAALLLDDIYERFLAPLPKGAATIPTVAEVSPQSAPVSGGITVAITGSGFSDATRVTFGGAAAPRFAVISDTKVIAVVPPLPNPASVSPSGYGVDAAVCTLAGCSPQYVPGNFTYKPNSH